MKKYMYDTLAFICLASLALAWNVAEAAIYCYPNGVVTTCFTDNGRTFSTQERNVRNPNTILIPAYPTVSPWIYLPQPPRREVPEQDFGECTLALGCIKDRR